MDTFAVFVVLRHKECNDDDDHHHHDDRFDLLDFFSVQFSSHYIILHNHYFILEEEWEKEKQKWNEINRDYKTPKP